MTNKLQHNKPDMRNIRSTAHLLSKCCFDALESRVLLTNVLQWRMDNAGTGNNPNETTLTPANLNSSTFGKIGSISLGANDQVYAQPLYVGNLVITGNGTNNGTHNVVFIATENDKVYAYDTTTLKLVWNTAFTAGAPIPKNTLNGPNEGNFTNTVGITGTPVITLSNSGTTGTMYFDATVFNSTASGAGQFSHIIYALNISSGTVVAQHPMNSLTGTLPTVLGNASDGNGTVVTFNVAKHLQRPALTILNNTVYVAYGSYADTDPYHGWLMGFDATTLALKSVFNSTPNNFGMAADGTHSGEGAIWMGAAAVTTDGTSLYLVTANGDFDPTNVNSYGDAVLRLVPDANTVQTSTTGSMTNGYGIHVADYFAPYNQAILGDYTIDLDLGSTGALLLPDHNNEVIIGSKQGVLYVMNSTSLGGYNSSSNVDEDLQEISLNAHSSRSTPAYFNNTVYVQDSYDVLKTYTVAANGLLSTTPAAVASTSAFPDYGATPFISSNGTANGITWDTFFSSSAQVLYAFDATTLAVLYTSSQKTGDNMGGGPHFTNPIVADGKVFVGGSTGFYVYGQQTPTGTPNAPTGATVSSVAARQLTVTWASNSTNETAFLVERSTDNGTTFTQIASVGVDATSYTDTNVTVGSTYFYRVRATDNGSNSAYTLSVGTTAQAMSTTSNLYHFDEGSGNTIGDSGGGTLNPGSINGTLGGFTTAPTWVAGYNGVGTALNFTGNNGAVNDNSTAALGSVVTLTSSLSSNLSTNATVVAWIKTTETGNDDPTLAPALFGVYQLNTLHNPEFTLVADEQDGSNDIRFGYIDASGHIGIGVDGHQKTPAVGDTFGVTSTTAINDGQWHAVAFTRNASNGLLSVYVDGVLQASFYGDIGPAVNGAKTATYNLIGTQIDKSSTGAVKGHSYYIGSLDELRTYNQVLSATEIAQLSLGAPAGLNANPISTNTIQLTWNNPNAFAQGIEIDRRIGTSGSFSLLTTLAGNATSFINANLSPGTQYFYEIRAGDTAGTSAFSTPVSAIAGAPHILARSTFYNHSAYDGNDAGNNTNDDNAIAPDKTALLPNATPSFANYTSYDKGVNGVIVDLTGTLSNFTASDITLKTGNSNSPASWTVLSTATITIRAIPGGGGNRIDITLPDGTVTGAWLQVTIDKTHTALTSSDQFYFGNAIGDTGNSPTDAKVTAVDEIGARFFAANLSTQSAATALTNVFDFNRDQQVNPADEAIAGAHYTNFLNALLFFTTPAGPADGPVADVAALPASVPVLALSPSAPTPGVTTPSASTTSDPATADLVVPAPPVPPAPPPAPGTSASPAVIAFDPALVVAAAPAVTLAAVKTKPAAGIHKPNALKRTGFDRIFALLAAHFGKS